MGSKYFENYLISTNFSNNYRALFLSAYNTEHKIWIYQKLDNFDVQMLTSDYLRETWKIFQDGRFRAWGSDRIFKRNSKKICKYSEIVKSLNLTFLSCYSNPGKYIFHWIRHIIGIIYISSSLYPQLHLTFTDMNLPGCTWRMLQWSSSQIPGVTRRISI